MAISACEGYLSMFQARPIERAKRSKRAPLLISPVAIIARVELHMRLMTSVQVLTSVQAALHKVNNSITH